MKRFGTVLAIAAACGMALAAAASAAPRQDAQNTPFNYKVDSKGNRVPKGNRVTNPDGSWREVIPGKCPTIKEMSANGVYKVSSDCSKPANPRSPS